MRRILTAITASALALSLVAQATPAQAAVPGYLSSYFGESAFLNLQQGSTGQFVAIFTNTGQTGWLRNSASQVNLGVCLSDKTTCNVASPNAAWNDGSWLSNIAYATHSTDFVGPGQNGFFVYNVKAPTTIASGTTVTFNGDLVLASTLQQIRPEGYYQAATVLSAASGTISISCKYTGSGTGNASCTGTVTGPSGATVTGLSAATANQTATANNGTVTCTANDGAFNENIEAVTCTGDANGASANDTDIVKITFTASFSNGGTATATAYVGDTTSPTVTGALGTGSDFNRFTGTCPTMGAIDTQTPITNTQYRVLNPDATTKIDWTSLPPLDGAYNELCESLDFRVDTTGFASGTYTLEVSANDSAGNRSRDTGCSFTPGAGSGLCQRANMVVTSGADTTPPTCAITTATQTGLKVSSTGNATDNVQISLVEIKVQRNDAGVWTDVTAYQAATASDGAFNEPYETWNFTSNDLTIPNNAPVQVLARVTDSSGNTNTCGPMALTTNGGNWNSSGITGGVTDTTPPLVTITNGSLTPAGSGLQNFTGTADDCFLVASACTRGNSNVTNVQFAITDTSGNTVNGWTACSPDDGAFNEPLESFTCTFTFPTTLTSQNGNQYFILARATDAGGNTGTPTSSTMGLNSADETCNFFLQSGSSTNNAPACEWIQDNNPPFISTSTVADAGSVGKVDTGDIITLTFPEQLRSISNTTPQSITLKDASNNTIVLTHNINSCWSRTNTGDFHNATGLATVNIAVGTAAGLPAAVATTALTGAGTSTPSCTAVTAVAGSVSYPVTIIGMANVRDWAGNSVILTAGDITIP